MHSIQWKYRPDWSVKCLTSPGLTLPNTFVPSVIRISLFYKPDKILGAVLFHSDLDCTKISALFPTLVGVLYICAYMKGEK